MAVTRNEVFCMNKQELCNIAGYSYKWIKGIDDRLPDEGKLFVESPDKKGRYRLDIFVQRWVEYKVADGADDSTTPIDEIKAQHERLKMEKTRIEVDRLKGQLVDSMEVRRLWANVAQTVKLNLMRIPSKLAPRLVSCDNSDYIGGEIDREITDALMALSECPMPDYIGEVPEEDKED